MRANIPLFILLTLALSGVSPAMAAKFRLSKEDKATMRNLLRLPEGGYIDVSPDGEYILMPKYNDKGDGGFAVFPVAYLKEHQRIGEGFQVVPKNSFEARNFTWMGENHIASNLIFRETYAGGVGAFKAKEHRGAAITTRNPHEYFMSLERGIPQQPNDILVEVGLKRRTDARRDYLHLLRLRLDNERRFEWHEMWRNDFEIDRWLMDDTGTPAFIINDDGTFRAQWTKQRNRRFGIDEWVLDTENLQELDLPGYTLGYLPSRNVMLCEVDEDDRSQLAFVDADTGAHLFQPLSDPAYDVISNETQFLNLRAGGEIAGVTYHKERAVTHYFVPQIAELHRNIRRQLPDHDVRIDGVSWPHQIAFICLTAPDAIGHMMAYDWDQQVLFPLFHHRSWLAGQPLAKMRPITFPAHDGTPIHGYLSLPPGQEDARNLPLVALTHGGPWVRDTWQYNREVQLLAAQGYAVLQVNYRGSDGYGDAYSLGDNLLDIAEQSPHDVVAGIEWVIKEGIADADRVAVMGASFGAFVSLAIIGDYPDLAACGIGFAGVYDLKLMRDTDVKRKKRFADNLYGDEETETERYESLSPVNRVAEAKAAVLLVHGSLDHRVGTNQANRMAKALRQSASDVTLVKESYLLHGFGNMNHVMEYYTRVLKFLHTHIGEGKEA